MDEAKRRQRRDLLGASLAVPVLIAAGVPLRARAAPTPACGDDGKPTPRQMEGPFYTPSTPRRTSLLEPGLHGARPHWFHTRAINRLTRDTDRPSSLALAVMVIRCAAVGPCKKRYAVRGQKARPDPGFPLGGEVTVLIVGEGAGLRRAGEGETGHAVGLIVERRRSW